MAILRDSPIFICGHPKAGTSLLRSLLDSHPEVIVYPEETGFFRRYLPNVLDKTLEKKLDIADRYLTHIFEWNQNNPPEHQQNFPDRDYSNIPVSEVRDEMRRLVKETFRHEGDMLSAAMLAFGKVSGKINSRTKYWVEKTPYNERYVEQIFSYWPDARCIHVVRDPRDNYVSYRKKHPDWTAKFFANNWNLSTRQGMENLKKFGAERYWLTTFEEFVQQPEKCLKNLIDFLNISDDPSLRQPTRAGLEWKGNSMWSDRFSQISATPVGRWTSSLSPMDTAAIQIIASREMKCMGYNQSVIDWKSINLVDRVRFAVELLPYKVKELIQ